jgi:hypothetical protein
VDRTDTAVGFSLTNPPPVFELDTESDEKPDPAKRGQSQASAEPKAQPKSRATDVKSKARERLAARREAQEGFGN